MKLEKFLEGYPGILFSETDDAIFVFFRLIMSGMCSARFAKLLNFACRYLEDKEIYLEIGTYAGFTLFSAGYESGRKFLGIDNFSESYNVVGSIKDRIQEHWNRYPGNHNVIDSDFRKVELSTALDGSKIGVFLIDGKHTYEDVMDSIQWAKPHLSDKALIFFDDINVPGVKKAINEVKEDSSFEEICFANSFYDSAPDLGVSSDRYIHNGFSVMKYIKNSDKEVANV